MAEKSQTPTFSANTDLFQDAFTNNQNKILDKFNLIIHCLIREQSHFEVPVPDLQPI